MIRAVIKFKQIYKPVKLFFYLSLLFVGYSPLTL